MDITELNKTLFLDVKNVFNWDDFDSVDVHLPKNGLISATIYWHNGPTSASHDFSASSMEEFNEKLFGFIEQMKKQ